MIAIERPSILTYVVDEALCFHLRLAAAVARRAKRLQLTKPEQHLITMVWLDMICDARCCYLIERETGSTQRV